MTKVWVIDTETTGLDPTTDKVVEIAGILLEEGNIIKHYQSLVNPEIPIPPKACAVHHIINAHVANAPCLDAAIQPILEEDYDYIVAHNAKFDRSFVGLGEVPWLCTHKLSHRLWPEAPGHSNQVLRYWLNLPDPVLGGHAHRAMYDTEVTASLFQHILTQATQSDPYPGMLKVSETPILLITVGFGKHYGKLWSEVDRGYLDFMINKSQGWDEDQLYTAKYWYERK